MTDLCKAAEMALEALEDMNCGWKYIRESHGDLYGVGWDRAQGKADDAIEALRQALDHLPDATKMMGLIPSEWAGLDEPPNSTTDVVEPEPAAYAEIKNGYPRSWLWNSEYVKANSNVKVTLYAAPPKREWVGLTDEEREYLWSITPIEDEYRFAFVLAVEAKLKEKNT